MKRKYKGITIPYLYYNKKENYTYYIYKDKEYTDLNKLFLDFIGVYLTYHFKIGQELYEVHNLNEVLDYLLKNKKDFKIPNQYKKEYSEEEYNYLNKLQDKLINDKLHIENKQNFEANKKMFNNRKLYQFTKEINDKYKNRIKPQKIHSKIFNHDYYVVAGNAYQSIYSALDEVFTENLYYEYGGTKSKNNRSHFHTHSFDELINLIFQNNREFKIHTNQQSYYSEQELIFLNKLAQKLKELGYHSVKENLTELDASEYFFLKDNHKYLSLLIYNIKNYFADKKYQKAVLKSHKI